MTEIPEDIAWLAERHQLEPRPGEPEEHFRERIAKIILEEGRDPYLFVAVVTGESVDEVQEKYMGDVHEVHKHMLAKKEALMKEVGDTYFRIPYPDFEPIAESAGFEQVHHHRFRTNYERTHQFSLWAKHELGFFLSARSYVGLGSDDSIVEQLDHAQLYYELNVLKPYGDLSKNEWEMFLRGVKGSNRTPDLSAECATRLCSVDVRERFLGKLYEIENCGFPTNNPWQYFSEQYVGVLDSEEARGEAADEEALKKERLISLPDKTKVMLGLEDLCN